MSRASRSPVAFFSLSVVLGAVSIAACVEKKQEGDGQGKGQGQGKEGQQGAAPSNKTLDELKVQVEAFQKATADVRTRFNALPEDVPGWDVVRSKLFAVEEVMGVEEARVKWLKGELTKAAASGKQDEMDKVEENIKAANQGIKAMGKPIVELSHELLPLEGMAARLRALLDAGIMYTHALPTGQQIKSANNEIERYLIEVAENPKKKPDKKAWVPFERVWFSADTAQIDFLKSKLQLDNVAMILKAYPVLRLEIGGFTDNKGSAADNKKLSAARAEAIRQTLIGSGVGDYRLKAEGFGPANPVCPANDTDDCREKNRRVAARVTTAK
jgi:outer membrane protein OmpA-like peptidoglycan-associated protein